MLKLTPLSIQCCHEIKGVSPNIAAIMSEAQGEIDGQLIINYNCYYQCVLGPQIIYSSTVTCIFIEKNLRIF